MDRRTTIDKPLEQVLKDDLMPHIYVEDGKLKVYGTLAGLNNLGKTYFVNWADIEKAYDYARTQLMQEFGNEVFGKSAQMKGQSSTGTASQTGQGNVVKEAEGGTGPLIDCQVNFLMDLPEKKSILSEAIGSFTKFIEAVNNFQRYVQQKCNDENWKRTHTENNAINNLNDAVRSFKNEGGPKSDENIAAWNKFHQIFNADPWKSDLNNDRQFKQLTDEILKQWKDWGGDASSFGTDNKTNKPNGNNKGRET